MNRALLLIGIIICIGCNTPRNRVFINDDNEKVLMSFLDESRTHVGDSILVCVTVDTMDADTIVSFASVKYPIHLSVGPEDYEEYRYSNGIPMQIVASKQLVPNISKFLVLCPDSKLSSQIKNDSQGKRHCNIRVFRKNYVVSSNKLTEVLD